MKPPLDTLAFIGLFVASSYMPALIATIFYTALCKKPEAPRFDPALHMYNKPDAQEMAKILQTVTKIQDSVSLLQSNGFGGGSSGGAGGGEDTERILMQTQSQLKTLAQSLESMQVSPLQLLLQWLSRVSLQAR